MDLWPEVPEGEDIFVNPNMNYVKTQSDVHLVACKTQSQVMVAIENQEHKGWGGTFTKINSRT